MLPCIMALVDLNSVCVFALSLKALSGAHMRPGVACSIPRGINKPLPTRLSVAANLTPDIGLSMTLPSIQKPMISCRCRLSRLPMTISDECAAWQLSVPVVHSTAKTYLHATDVVKRERL